VNVAPPAATKLRRESRRLTRFAPYLVLFLLQAHSGLSAQATWGAIEVVGRSIEPGTSSNFLYLQEQTYQSSFVNTQVLVSRGNEPGPTLCLTAGIHGDEMNGVEVARRSFFSFNAADLKGTLIVLPAVNATGVRAGDRYLTDRRDLNRAFPGKEGGSIAALIANAVMTTIMVHCQFLVDLHTGSDQRGNLPQIRADLSNPAIRELAVHFGRGLVIDGAGPDGSLRREAAKTGIAAIIYEAGEPDRFQDEEIEHGLEGVSNVMAYLGMIDAPPRVIPASRVFTKSRWVRAGPTQSGHFFPRSKLGDSVKAGDLLGITVDPYTNEAHEIVSPIDGELVGMAVSRPVLAGYGLFHLAWSP
jgi:predicted deacylase